MSSLSPIAQDSAVTNLANFFLTANISSLSSPLMATAGQNLTGSVQLPIELDQAAHGIGMPTVFVKPAHLNYLRDFRTQQCQQFASHKCTQHKPFTCFHWHFPNQRRRRPLRKTDGTFSYSPDVYCDKYDETRGECPNGDACPYLHRNAGDTERRYHLRYFKTGTCIHDTDSTGHCSRNGAHCAFAHGANDLRVPVYDIREVQEANDCPVNLPASLEKERVLSEDPKWNDMTYVLANYKTEQCRKPPRMCRQGYACPFYHNNKDKRRGPHTHKYRSTPCPTVKNSDEWLDSSLCDQADQCQYCHTRTEQQFHPEIYKSTKCNDVMQQSYCPRGPFCAFAHDEAEMNFGRSFLQDIDLQAQGAIHQLQLQQLQQYMQQQQHQQLPHQQQPSQHQQLQHQHHQQQQQQQPLPLAPLALSRLMSPNPWEQTGVSPPAGRSRKSSTVSDPALTSPGSSSRRPLHAQSHSRPATAQQLSPGSAMLPDLEDLDLQQPETCSSEGSGSFSPLTVATATGGSGPIGIPGAGSPGFQSPAAAGQAESGSVQMHAAFDAGSHHRRRMHSGGELSSASSTYAQSPILMSNSPFSNPGMDLERLQYQQEIERAREEARRMQEAMQAAQRERDEAQKQLETVRAKLIDISGADAMPDVENCSPEQLEQLKQSLMHRLQSVQQLSQSGRSSQPPPLVAPHSLQLGSSSDSGGFSASLATVEENSGDVTPNPSQSETASAAAGEGGGDSRFTFVKGGLGEQQEQRH